MHEKYAKFMQNFIRESSSEGFTSETHDKQDDNINALVQFSFLFLLILLIFYNLFHFTSLCSLSSLFFFFYRPTLFLMFILFSHIRSIRDLDKAHLEVLSDLYFWAPSSPRKAKNYSWKDVCLHVCIFMYVYMYICMYVCRYMSMNLRLATARTSEWILFTFGI